MASAHGSPAQDGEQDLLEPAWQMRWRVPELALVLSDRAVAHARLTGDRALRLRAEAVAVFASNRLGHGVSATGRAIAGVRDAEAVGDEDVAAQLRVELACCARCAGSHEVALRVLYPVLERERVDPTVRAHALIELAAALPAGNKNAECVEALDEADRLYTSAAELSGDTSRLLRARVCRARAAHHRRHAEFATAVEAAGAGLDLLDQLGDPDAESGEIHAHLVLERVQALFELGEHAEAAEAAERVLAEPVRAASAEPSGWVRLALATRLHLADERYDDAIRLLNEAVAAAGRHRLDELLAEALGTSSHVHEKCADFPEALRCLRSAYAADRRWRSAVHAARIKLLEEFPSLSEVAVPAQTTRESASASRSQHAEGYQSATETPRGGSARLAEPVDVPEPAQAPDLTRPPDPAQRSKHAQPAGHAESADHSRNFEHGQRSEHGRRAARTRPAEAAQAPEFVQPSTPGQRAESASRQESPQHPRSTGHSEPGRRTRSRRRARPEEEHTRAAQHSGGAGETPPSPAESATGTGLAAASRTPAAEEEWASSWPSGDTTSEVSGATESAPLSAFDSAPPIGSAGETEGGDPWPAVGWPLEPEFPSEFGTAAEGRTAGAAESAAPATERAGGERLAETSGPGRDDPDRPDVTAFMPVISSTSDETEERWPDPEQRTPAYEEAWLRTDPLQTDLDPLAVDTSFETSQGDSVPSEPPEPGDSGVPGDIPAQETEPWSEVGAPETAPQVDDSDPAPSGRRAQGRSLADIRESLRVLQERSEIRDTATSSGGRRRARHAEPDADEQASAQPVAEFLARYRETVPEQPTSRDEPAPQPVDEPDPAETGSAGLADLLAEALLAYEDGRRDVPESDSETGGRHGGSPVSGITGDSTGERRRRSMSDSEASARHRRTATDSTRFRSWSWAPPSY